MESMLDVRYPPILALFDYINRRRDGHFTHDPIHEAVVPQPAFGVVSEVLDSELDLEMTTNGIVNLWKKRTETEIGNSQSAHYLAALFLVDQGGETKETLKRRFIEGVTYSKKLECEYWPKYLKKYNAALNIYHNNPAGAKPVSLPKKDIQPEVLNLNGIPGKAPAHVHYLTTQSFVNEKTKNSKELDDLTREYYKSFKKGFFFLKRATANDIPFPIAEEYDVSVNTGLPPTKFPISNLASLAGQGQPALLRISANGGTGKSTFIWQLMKEAVKRIPVWFLYKVDQIAIDYIETHAPIGQPLLIFTDDLLKNTDQIGDLPLFSEQLAMISVNRPVLLIIAERSFRYEKCSRRIDFEAPFDRKALLNFSNVDFRQEVFRKVYELIMQEGQRTAELERRCWSYFNEYDFDSLVDSVYNMLDRLDKTAVTYDYPFDWTDWQSASDGYIFKDLYKVVAFFFRFGIEVPLNYLEDYYGEKFQTDELLQFLGRFQETQSPIIYDPTMERLSLRHEKAGEWFFKMTALGNEVEALFFKKFMVRLKSPYACYLFRNLFRGNPEFEQTNLYRQATPNIRIELIENYLGGLQGRKFGEEECKLLMEEHFIYYNTGSEDEAIGVLRVILEHSEGNIQAMTRLAFCLENTSVQESENLYQQVLQLSPGNPRALLPLVALFSRRKSSEAKTLLDEAVDLASADSRYASMLIDFLGKNKWLLKRPLAQSLVSMHEDYKVFRFQLAKLFVSSGHGTEALVVIDKLELSPFAEKPSVRRNIAALLVPMFGGRLNISKERSIDRAEKLLNDLPEADTDFASLVLLSTIYQKTGRYGAALAGYRQALSIYPDNLNVFNLVCEYYRKIYRETRELNYLVEAENFIETQLARFDLDTDEYILRELELWLIRLELVRQYLASQDNSARNKGLLLIPSGCSRLNAIAEHWYTFLKPLLTNDYQGSKYSRLIEGHSKAVSLLRKIQGLASDRPIAEELHLTGFSAVNETYIEDMIVRALELDPKDEILFLDLFRLRLKRPESDIETLISQKDFNGFHIKTKIELLKTLFVSGYAEKVRQIILGDSFLDCIDLAMKADLLNIYVGSGHYGHALRLVFSLHEIPDRLRSQVRRLALEIPFVAPAERLKAKLLISERLLIAAYREDIDLKVNICRTLFCMAQVIESRQYYAQHIAPEKLRSFDKQSESWFSDLLENRLQRLFSESKGPFYVHSLMTSFTAIFNVRYNFNTITHQLDNEFNERIKEYVRAALNIVFRRLMSRNAATRETAIQFLLDLQERLSIHFLNETIMRKIVDVSLVAKTDFNTYQSFLVTVEPLIMKYQTVKNPRPPLLLSIGRYHLLRLHFKVANDYYRRAFYNESADDFNRCSSLNGRAEVIISSIEHFGGKWSIVRTELTKAEEKIDRALTYNPNFKFAANNRERIAKLRRRYKIN